MNKAHDLIQEIYFTMEIDGEELTDGEVLDKIYEMINYYHLEILQNEEN